MVSDFLNLKGQDKSCGKYQESGSNVDDQRKNSFNALHSKGEQESIPTW